MGDFVNKSFILDASENNKFNITYRENKYVGLHVVYGDSMIHLMN